MNHDQYEYPEPTGARLDRPMVESPVWKVSFRDAEGGQPFQTTILEETMHANLRRVLNGEENAFGGHRIDRAFLRLDDGCHVLFERT